ncbi:MAG: hypothetical protein AB7N76_32800 [Planctomycetota bacterium]
MTQRALDASRLLGASLLLALAGCRADLRPAPLDEREAPREEARGRELLARGATTPVLSGARPWRELPGIEVELDDEYFGLVGAIGRPWPTDPCRLRLRFLPGRCASVASFQDGERRVRWGIHEWNTWRAEGDAAPEYDDDSTIAFWLPTLQYFLEIAFRLPEAGIVDAAGPAEVQGHPCQRVYLTWGSYTPNADLDQYLAYVDEATGLVRRVDFTVRDVAGFVTGTVLLSDFREVGGYLLPHVLEIGEDPPEDLLHRITVRSWRPGVEVTRPEVAPDPQRGPGRKP